MRKILAIICLAVFILLVPVSSIRQMDLLRIAGFDGDNEVFLPAQTIEPVTTGPFFPRYEITARYDAETGVVEGEAVITYQNPEDMPLNHLQFNLVADNLAGRPGSITVNQVKVDGKPNGVAANLPANSSTNSSTNLSSTSSGGLMANPSTGLSTSPSTLLVALPIPLARGQEARVSISFKTVVPDQPRRLGRAYGIAMVTGWYPLLAPRRQGQWESFPADVTFGDPYYAESAYYRVRLKVSRDIKVVASADSFIQQPAGSDTLWSFQTTRPVREFAFAASRDFRFKVDRVGNTLLVLAYTSRTDKSSLATATRALEYYQQLLGDYPYRQLTVVRVPLRGNMGMEYPGMVFLSDMEPYGQFTVAHEVAHQWWYNLVGSNQVKEPWLDEGLANFMALLYSEKFEQQSFPARLREFSAVPAGQGLTRPLSDFSGEAEYRQAVYVQAAMFWYRLSPKIERKRLIQLLRDVQETYRFRVVTWQDFRSYLLEAGADPDLIDSQTLPQGKGTKL